MSTARSAADIRQSEHASVSGVSGKKVFNIDSAGNVLDFQARDYLLEVARGNVAGHSLVHKFGANAALSNSMAPIASAMVYQTPTAAVSLEFVSSSAADALDDVGMQEITVIGLDANWDEQTVVMAAHATDGTTAVAISGTWLRVYRAYVSSSKTYASAAAGSHVGTITIRVASAGATYAEISLSNGFPMGQSLIGAYTVPAGFTAYILTQAFSSDVSGTKTTSFYFFKRPNADDVATPYSGIMRVQNLTVGTQGIGQFYHDSSEKFLEKTDIGYMGITDAGTFSASVEFEILLIAN